MGGENATTTTASGRKAARTRSRRGSDKTKDELYQQARARHIQGRSKMSKRQLENALHH